MATKENQLFLKGNSFVTSNSNNDSQFSNVNLNQNYLKQKDTFVQSKSKSNNDKKFASFKADTFVSDNHHKNESSKLWKKSSDNSCLESFIAEREARNQGKNDKRSVNSNSSTLSLHITAYENTVEAAKKDSAKKSNLPKAFDSSVKAENPFELPRQMEDNASSNSTPEVMQFRASQRMLSSNQAALQTVVETSLIAEFKYGDKTKKFSIASLTPARLAQAFQLDVNSLSVTDDQQFGYMPIEDKFEPALVSNKCYEVDGLSLAVSNSPNEAQIVLRNMNNNLRVIQGDQALALKNNVIANCKDLDESANMLFHGPFAALMVKSIAVLSCCAPDANLDIATLLPEIKARLGDAGSFRASLQHVANIMCKAFRVADYNMKQICAYTSDLPDYLNEALTAVWKNDENARDSLNRALAEVKKASDKCTESADLVYSKFEEVIGDINALIVASLSSKTENVREKTRLMSLKEVLTVKQKKMEAHQKQVNKEFAEAKADTKKAFENYQKVMKENPGFFKLCGAAIVDGIVSVAHALTFNIGRSFGGQRNVERPDLFNHGMEMGLLKTLNEICGKLSDHASLNDATISDFIASINSFRQHYAATTEGLAISHLAQDVQNFLNKNKSSLVDGSDDVGMKNEISSLKNSIQNVERTYYHAQEQKKNQASASDTCCGKIAQAYTEKLDASKHMLDINELKSETLRKEVNESEKELTDLICQLKSIDFNTADLSEILKYLADGIGYLNKVKESWGYLVEYFGNMKIIIDGYLTSNIEKFIEGAQDPVSNSFLLQNAFKAIAYSIEISSSARIYSAVSSNHIMPVISSVGKELNLSIDAAQAKHGEIESDFEKKKEEVTELIEEKKKEKEKHFIELTETYRFNMAQAVKNGAIEAARAIQR